MDGIISRQMFVSYINSCYVKEIDEKKYIAHKWNINGNLKREYSSIPSKEHDKALLALLSIDITNDTSIVDFCWKYGRLGLMNINRSTFHDTWSEKHKDHRQAFVNYDSWMISNQTDTKYNQSENSECSPFYEGYESLDLYRAVISSFQCCAKLRSSLSEKNLKKSIEFTCYLLDFLYIPNDSDISDFGENLITDLGLDPNDYLDEYDEFSAPWSDNYLDGTISFNIDLDSILQNLSANRIEELLSFCQSILSFWISIEIQNIHLNMSPDFIYGKFTASMSVSNMNEFFWYIIFLKFTNAQIIRKCASSTCNKYFIIYGNDTRKIYCSTGCANIEAKRSERKRKSERKEGK